MCKCIQSCSSDGPELYVGANVADDWNMYQGMEVSLISLSVPANFWIFTPP